MLAPRLGRQGSWADTQLEFHPWLKPCSPPGVILKHRAGGSPEHTWVWPQPQNTPKAKFLEGNFSSTSPATQARNQPAESNPQRCSQARTQGLRHFMSSIAKTGTVSPSVLVSVVLLTVPHP